MCLGTYFGKSRSISYHMSRIMRRPAFYMCEDGDVDHFRSERGGGRRLCFLLLQR